MTQRSRWIVVALAVAGLAFAGASAWVHYKILTDPTYISPCDMSSTFNCSQVYQSRYGSVAGVPVALAGIFWFGLVALVAWLSAPTTGKSSKHGFDATLQVLSFVGLAVVLYLGLTSWFVLKTACVLCIGTYVAVIGIFLTVTKSKTKALSEFGNEIGPVAQKAGVGIFVLLAAVGFAAYQFPREGAPPPASMTVGVEGLTRDAINKFAAAWAKQPRISTGVPADGAQVVVVKFNDFQCPLCGTTNNMYKPVFEKFEQSNPGAVRYALKDWPWNAKCNQTLNPAGGEGHAGACEAAAAARMAHDQGHDAEMKMRDWLYGNHLTLSPETVKAAAESQLGVKDFAAEYEKKVPGIREDIALGAALRISATPTYFINGVRLGETLHPAYFELAIQLELNKK